MIKNFENLTYEITPDEEQIMSSLIAGLRKRVGKEHAITGSEIVSKINDSMKPKRKFTEVRLRKMVNHIRSHAMLPVLASSSGYYISYDKAEVQQEVESLMQRANGIRIAADGLKKFML